MAKNQSPSTDITAEYVMTYLAPLDPPVAIDDGMMIVNVRPGGWVKGPNINGKLISPGADWLRIMPSGAFRLDVRTLIETDDHAHIYMSYNGIIKNSEQSAERLNNGEMLTHKDIPYLSQRPPSKRPVKNTLGSMTFKPLIKWWRYSLENPAT
jgi:hypothetical protein